MWKVLVKVLEEMEITKNKYKEKLANEKTGILNFIKNIVRKEK